MINFVGKNNRRNGVTPQRHNGAMAQWRSGIIDVRCFKKLNFKWFSFEPLSL
jgi:hypothetical protein